MSAEIWKVLFWFVVINLLVLYAVGAVIVRLARGTAYEDHKIVKSKFWVTNWDFRGRYNLVRDGLRTRYNRIVHPAPKTVVAVPAGTVTPADPAKASRTTGIVVGSVVVMLCCSALVLIGLVSMFGLPGIPATTSAGDVPLATPTSMHEESLLPRDTAVPTEVVAVAAVPTHTAAPTLIPATPTPNSMEGCMGDVWYASGEFAGALPCDLLPATVEKSVMAGNRFVIGDGTEVGSDKGWNQPTFTSPEWEAHLCGVTIICIEPGETVTMTIRWDLRDLDLGSGIHTPYSSLLNAQLTKANDAQYYTLVTEGYALSAIGHKIPFTTSYDGADPQSGTSAEMAGGREITMTFSCPAGAVPCQYGLGGYGLLTDYLTGQSNSAMQLVGGNNAEPQVLAPDYDGVLAWIESMR